MDKSVLQFEEERSSKNERTKNVQFISSLLTLILDPSDLNGLGTILLDNYFLVGHEILLKTVQMIQNGTKNGASLKLYF